MTIRLRLGRLLPGRSRPAPTRDDADSPAAGLCYRSPSGSRAGGCVGRHLSLGRVRVHAETHRAVAGGEHLCDAARGASGHAGRRGHDPHAGDARYRADGGHAGAEPGIRGRDREHRAPDGADGRGAFWARDGTAGGGQFAEAPALAAARDVASAAGGARSEAGGARAAGRGGDCAGGLIASCGAGGRGGNSRQRGARGNDRCVRHAARHAAGHGTPAPAPQAPKWPTRCPRPRRTRRGVPDRAGRDAAE